MTTIARTPMADSTSDQRQISTLQHSLTARHRDTPVHGQLELLASRSRIVTRLALDTNV